MMASAARQSCTATSLSAVAALHDGVLLQKCVRSPHWQNLIHTETVSIITVH